MSVTNLTDTYWRWNNDPTVWGFDSADLLFESNGVSCNYVSITESYDISDLPHTMEYFTADDSFYAWDSSHGWYDEAYREIHITGGDDVEDTAFIELLENSATQFVPPVPYMTTSTELTSIADAIRTKGGTSAPLVYPAGFVSAINDISAGGGGGLTDFTLQYTPTEVFASGCYVCFADITNKIVYLSGLLATNTPVVMMGIDIPISRYFGSIIPLQESSLSYGYKVVNGTKTSVGRSDADSDFFYVSGLSIRDMVYVNLEIPVLGGGQLM